MIKYYVVTTSLKRDHKKRSFLGTIFREDALNHCTAGLPLFCFFPQKIWISGLSLAPRGWRNPSATDSHCCCYVHRHEGCAKVRKGRRCHVESDTSRGSCSTVRSPDLCVLGLSVQVTPNPSLVSSWVDLVLLDVRWRIRTQDLKVAVLKLLSLLPHLPGCNYNIRTAKKRVFKVIEKPLFSFFHLCFL